MKIGFHLPQWGRNATHDGIVAVARTVEDAGLDAVWVADHLIHPGETSSHYPYNPTGQIGWQPDEGFLEPLQMLLLAATATQRIAVGLSALVLPMRHPLLAAKSAATLQLLCGGRLILGVATGWWKEELEALGVPFEARGRRSDEQLAIIRQAWSTGKAEWHGEFYDFNAVTVKPVPAPAPPIWVGGTGQPTWRRVARYGDGWHATGSRSDVIEEGCAAIHAACRELGRNPASLTISTTMPFPTSRDDAIRRLLRLGNCGVDNVVLQKTDWDDLAGFCASIERFANDVLPELRHELAAFRAET